MQKYCKAILFSAVTVQFDGDLQQYAEFHFSLTVETV
jgi:hypothetical protein